ncbi:MAG: MvaI/BcnI restriction endonuclease family protein [Ignavibacteriales bacterium]|nr:MAG: MvaI/BcnI restriction endonuclease family protein [Ignavibacteriales bacterium]
MNLENLLSLFRDKGCSKVYVKELSPNDNSKNQVYLGGSYDVLNILPFNEIKAEGIGDWKRERFKATVNFGWIGEDGNIFNAPFAQLILYPKYPEVRFSGFLKKCDNPPSEIMSGREAGRLLFLGVADGGKLLGKAVFPDSEVAQEFVNYSPKEETGLFKVLYTKRIEDHRAQLLTELRRITSLGWIDSKRLDRTGNILPCNSSNCGGYTLEAELGITPNGYSEPDYLGWEIKQFGVKDLNKTSSAVVTLMTPEPDSGYYHEYGASDFVRKYGYSDLRGRIDRLNFGGIFKAGLTNVRTGLKLEISGFDKTEKQITSTGGKIILLDNQENEAAAWTFSSVISHWKRKHTNACYIPSLLKQNGSRKYKYGNNILLGLGTDFVLFLAQLSLGNIYYDPGIKIENASTNPRTKQRSQFRIKSRFLSELYRNSEWVTL